MPHHHAIISIIWLIISVFYGRNLQHNLTLYVKENTEKRVNTSVVYGFLIMHDNERNYDYKETAFSNSRKYRVEVRNQFHTLLNYSPD